MFRLTQFLKELKAPTPVRPRRDPPGPVVIWNLIRRCNLVQALLLDLADVDFPGELDRGGLPRHGRPRGGPRAGADPVRRRASVAPRHFRHLPARQGDGLLCRPLLKRRAHRRRQHRRDRRHRLRLRRNLPRRHRRDPRPVPRPQRSLRGLARRRAALPGRGHQGRPALHHDNGQPRRAAGAARPRRPRGRRQVLPLASRLCRPRQQEPRGRCRARDHARGDGGRVRAPGPASSAARKRNSSPATTTPTAFFSTSGPAAGSPIAPSTCAPSSPSGAAIRRA